MFITWKTELFVSGSEKKKFFSKAVKFQEIRALLFRIDSWATANSLIYFNGFEV